MRFPTCTPVTFLAALFVGIAPANDASGLQSAATDQAPQDAGPPGMVWIRGGEFLMGSDGDLALPAEGPPHRVRVTGFWIDATEVTNAQFRAFVEATGYVTTAEVAPKLEEIMAQLPPGTPPPDPEVLQPGSLVFRPTRGPVPLHDFSRWWAWTPGASWRHPEGPGSSIEGKDDHPVVQVSWLDARAYARWAGKDLPTEAQWEFAARGGLRGQPFVWGDERISDQVIRANIWQGRFPYENLATDGYPRTAPVRSYPANGYGLYDMAGNVWEWCRDWYRADAYSLHEAGAVAVDPAGPARSYDPREPYAQKRVIRGGSFLCSDSYCSSYRPSARMANTVDSSTNHMGIRCVMSSRAWKARSSAEKADEPPPPGGAPPP